MILGSFPNHHICTYLAFGSDFSALFPANLSFTCSIVIPSLLYHTCFVSNTYRIKYITLRNIFFISYFVYWSDSYICNVIIMMLTTTANEMKWNETHNCRRLSQIHWLPEQLQRTSIHLHIHHHGTLALPFYSNFIVQCILMILLFTFIFHLPSLSNLLSVVYYLIQWYCDFRSPLSFMSYTFVWHVELDKSWTYYLEFLQYF